MGLKACLGPVQGGALVLAEEGRLAIGDRAGGAALARSLLRQVATGEVDAEGAGIDLRAASLMRFSESISSLFLGLSRAISDLMDSGEAW